MKTIKALSEDELLKVIGGELASESTQIQTAIGKIIELPDGKFTWCVQDDSNLKNKFKDCKVVGTLVSALGYTFKYDQNGVLEKIITIDGEAKELNVNLTDFTKVNIK